jgi:hypothetical protein
MVRICYQQDASGVSLQFSKAVSAKKKRKIAFPTDETESFTKWRRLE